MTSYTFESSKIQQDFLLLCFATSAPSIAVMIPSATRKDTMDCELSVWPTVVEIFEGGAFGANADLDNVC